MIDAKVNKLKGNKTVDYILKPDTPTYNPFDLLEYDNFHQFLPNRNLDYHTFERVQKMIEILGINTIRRQRERYLIAIFNQIALEEKTWDEVKLDEYPTAFSIYVQSLENEDVTLDDIL